MKNDANFDDLDQDEEAELRGAGAGADNSSNSFNSCSDVKHTTAQWPDPPAQEAFYGLAGDIVRVIEPHSEADPTAILDQTLIGFGNVVGRRPHFRVESDTHYTNEYTIEVGNTSKGRKGTSWGRARGIFEADDPDWVRTRIQDGLSSGEGLISAVRDPTEKQEPIRKRGSGEIEGYQTVIEDQGVSDKRLLVVQTEFASTLRVLERDGNTLSAVTRQAWDTGNLRTLTKKPMSATDAHISIIGHISCDELRRYLNRTEAGNGFANRFMFHCVRRSKLLPEGGSPSDVDLAPLRCRLQEAIEFARTVTEMCRDEDTRAIWREVYQELSQGKPGLLGAITSRAEAHVTRLSCIYALLDRSAVIRRPHLMAALALWEHAEESARFIFGDALGDPNADAILKALRMTAAGLTQTDIMAFFNRNKPANEIQRALEVLIASGLAKSEIEETKGRCAERWYAL